MNTEGPTRQPAPIAAGYLAVALALAVGLSLGAATAIVWHFLLCTGMACLGQVVVPVRLGVLAAAVALIVFGLVFRLGWWWAPLLVLVVIGLALVAGVIVAAVALLLGPAVLGWARRPRR